ncbi:MAG: radical SAM protein [Luteitalea sp.]|nr:radical SAM protein [Luteitalea sp.]
MNRLQSALRDIRGYPTLRAAKRLFDRKPLQCSLYVTDQCNLDCAYCTEYDNSRPHPSLVDLTRWLTRIRDLGTVRVALVGGEPLMHPDIVEIVRRAKQLGLSTSLTTNGFLLTRSLVEGLEEAGLEVMQISVDRMTPSQVTRKSFKTVLPKLDVLADSSINVHITGVLCDDTMSESRAVLKTGLDRGVPTEVRLVHADPNRQFRVEPGERDRLETFLLWMRQAKEAGVKIHTNDAILNYQLSLVRGEQVDWVCAAGFKIFFVSAQGKFWLCSMRHTDQDIMDVTPAHLLANDGPKSCQDGCGVYCCVNTSMLYQNPVRMIGREVRLRLKRIPAPAPQSAPRGAEGM